MKGAIFGRRERFWLYRITAAREEDACTLKKSLSRPSLLVSGLKQL